MSTSPISTPDQPGRKRMKRAVVDSDEDNMAPTPQASFPARPAQCSRFTELQQHLSNAVAEFPMLLLQADDAQERKELKRLRVERR